MYATRQDIEATYGTDLLYQVTDGTVDQVRVDQALQDASDEVDMSLRGRYAVPLATVPAIVKRWVIDIALAMLPADGAAGSDIIAERAKAARQALKDLRSGATSFDLPAAASTAPTVADDVRYEAPSPMFSGDALRGF